MKNLLTNLFYECKGSMFFEHTQMFLHEKFRKEANFDLNQHFVYVHKYKFTYVHKFAKQFNTPCASFFCNGVCPQTYSTNYKSRFPGTAAAYLSSLF